MHKVERKCFRMKDFSTFDQFNRFLWGWEYLRKLKKLTLQDYLLVYQYMDLICGFLNNACHLFRHGLGLFHLKSWQGACLTSAFQTTGSDFSLFSGVPCSDFSPLRILARNDATRQLPIGAGYCQWGGYIDRNVCKCKKSSLNVQKLQIFAIFASYLASIVKAMDEGAPKNHFHQNPNHFTVHRKK